MILILLITLMLSSQPYPSNQAIMKHTDAMTCQTLKSDSNFCVHFWEYKEILK